jgi:predicted glycosyltransferase
MMQGISKRKIVVYSHDTFGLGNIRRMLTIAKALVESDPGNSVLILSGSPMLHAFRIPPQIDYIKLPCLTRTMTGEYAAKFLDLRYDQILKLRSNIIQSAILDFDPDLILVDKKPYGVGDELAPALKSLRVQKHRAKLVLLLRDILDSPEPTMRVWQKNHYHAALDNHYHQVLVVGSPEIFDLRHEYQFPKSSHEKVRFCGYLAREMGKTAREPLRRQLGMEPHEKLVLVTPGGGEDGYQLLRHYIQGLGALQSPPGFKSLIICGPEMAESQRQHIQRATENRDDVILQNFTDDMMACMGASDLVISMGGYNTVCELLTLGKRAIVVPRVNPVKEQWIRAERMDKRRLLRAIHPDELTAEGLIAAVKNEINQNDQQPAAQAIDMNGLANVCSALNQLMQPKSNNSGNRSGIVNLYQATHPTLQAATRAS